MLEILNAAALVAVAGNGRSGKVERASILVSHNLDRVRVGDVMCRTRSLDGGDHHFRSAHWLEKRFKMFRTGQWLVTLNIHVDVCADPLRHFTHAVCTAAMTG